MDSDMFTMLFASAMTIMWILVWGFSMVVSIGSIVIMVVCRYKIFKMAGYEGWEAIIPFYGDYIFAELTLGNGIWFLLSFVPMANIVFLCLSHYRLGQSFGKGTGFAVGLILLTIVFLPILAFGKGNVYRKLPPLI